MTAERAAKLEALGFAWEMSAAAISKQFERTGSGWELAVAASSLAASKMRKKNAKSERPAIPRVKEEERRRAKAKVKKKNAKSERPAISRVKEEEKCKVKTKAKKDAKRQRTDVIQAGWR
jgi:hypothetical protein